MQVGASSVASQFGQTVQQIPKPEPSNSQQSVQQSEQKAEPPKSQDPNRGQSLDVTA